MCADGANCSPPNARHVPDANWRPPKKPLPVFSCHWLFDSQLATRSQTEAAIISVGSVPSKSRSPAADRPGSAGPIGAAETGIAIPEEAGCEVIARDSDPGS